MQSIYTSLVLSTTLHIFLTTMFSCLSRLRVGRGVGFGLAESYWTESHGYVVAVELNNVYGEVIAALLNE